MSVALLSDHTVVDAQNPWPGLSAYDEAAERFFSGRDAESEELLGLVGQATLTVLFGKSGLGKTSLLQAGLFPRLRRRNVLPVHIRLDVRARSAPLIEQVASALAAEIVERLVDATAPNADESVWEHLHGRDVAWWSDKNQPLTPLFVLDQFEEVFTLGAENPEGIAQLRLDLADLIENRIPAALAQRIERGGSAEHLDLRGQRYKLLISFREDFLPEVEGWKRELPSLMRNRLRLLPMTADRALQVVSGETPTGRVHELVSDETAREIVRFVAAVQSTDERARGTQRTQRVAAEPWETVHIEPALLSLVCEGLNGKRKAQGRATIDAALLAETGRAIIGDFYEACVADVPDKTRRFIEDALITEGGFRNSYPREDAVAQGVLTEALLQQLVNRRLLRIDHQLGVERVELIHDRLTDVVRERRDRARRRQQRRRWWAVNAVAVVLVALSASFLYLWLGARHAQRVAEAERQRADGALREAIAGKLLTRSRAILEGHRAVPGGIGLLLTAASYRLKPDNAGYGGLQYALTAALGLVKVVGFPDPVIDISPDGRTVVTVQDNAVRLWDATTGRPRGAPLQGHTGSVTTVAFSPDGRTLASGSADRTVRVWDLGAGQARGLPLQGHTDPLTTLAFSPDGRTLVSGSSEMVRLWDLSTGRSRSAVHEGGVTSVAFSPDGKTFVSGSDDKTVRVWDAATGQPRGEPLKGHTETVRSVAFSPDGKTLASGADRTLRLWDARTGHPRGGPLEGHTGWVTSIAFSFDGKTLVSGSGDRTLRLWDAGTGRLRGTLRGHTGWVAKVVFSSDGKMLVSTSYDRTLRLWGTSAEQPRGAPLQGHTNWVTSIAFSPDGRTLASRGFDGMLRLWDAGTGQLRGAVRPPDAPLPDDSTRGIATRRIGERETADTKEPATNIAFSPDGRTLASGGFGGTLRLWDADTGKARGAPVQGHTGWVMSVAFSPDGRTIASGSADRTLRLWDAGTGQSRGAPLEGHTRRVTSVAFSPDGATLASGSADGTLRLWGAANGQPRGAPLLGHTDAVASVTFSPDGKTIASGSADRTLRLWDAGTGQSRGAPLEGHTGWVTSVAFSPDGRTLASGSFDRTLRLWDAPAGWIDLLCAKVVRNLSEAEWREHVGDIPYTEQCPGLPVSRD